MEPVVTEAVVLSVMVVVVRVVKVAVVTMVVVLSVMVVVVRVVTVAVVTEKRENTWER